MLTQASTWSVRAGPPSLELRCTGDDLPQFLVLPLHLRAAHWKLLRSVPLLSPAAPAVVSSWQTRSSVCPVVV